MVPLPTPQQSPAPGLAPACTLPRSLTVSELHSITLALQVVTNLRGAGQAQPHLLLAVQAIKQAQCHRFRRSYADVLDHHDWSAAAHFFLQELYGERDYSQRDAQFGRIAPVMQRLFPASVVSVATTLTQLHAVTEQFDYAMGAALLALQPSLVTESAARFAYVQVWKAVGQPQARAEQLALVQRLGNEMSQLTRTHGLRMMLRMMRGAANASGLHDLQHFLELGFDTFAALHRSKGGVTGFLALVDQRERAWMARLFEAGDANTYGNTPWPELE
ncbi:MAG: hypothetical protein WB821_10295 [Burkholderiaceae bacterium]